MIHQNSQIIACRMKNVTLSNLGQEPYADCGEQVSLKNAQHSRRSSDSCESVCKMTTMTLSTIGAKNHYRVYGWLNSAAGVVIL